MYHQPNQGQYDNHPNQYPQNNQQPNPFAQNNQPYQQAFPGNPAMPPPPGYNQYQPTNGPVMPPPPGYDAQNKGDVVYDPYGGAGEDFGLSNKLSTNTRLAFIRKVLGILAAQFALTAIGVTIAVTNRAQSLPFFHRHMELMIIAVIGYLVTLYALACYKSVARAVPTNYILLTIFTSCMTYMVSATCSLYDPEIVLAAAVLTAATVGALAIYAITTKTDFTYCGGAMWAFFFIVMTGTMLCIFMRPGFRVRILLSCLIIFMCCFYIIYDIQLLVGEKSHEISIDDYVFCAMMIYVDIIRLFIEILRVLGKK